jgi:hypothetical protein
MRHLKILGLAAIAALGLMALVGAGTASATTLATDVAGTAHYTKGTVMDLSLKSGTSALLETTEGAKIATCTTSTAKGKFEGPVVKTGEVEYVSGTWITGAIEELTWGDPEGKNCSQPTKTLANGSLEIMKTGADEAEIVGKNTSTTMSVFGVSCVYGTSAEGNKLGTIKGGEAPELVISAVLPRKEGGFLCPGSTRATTTYVVTSPHALHFVE